MIPLLLFYFCSCVNSENWAYLLAGSKSWENYRHQADIAHAHRYLQAQKFDTDKVIIAMYDDIARDTHNKYYNSMRNQPSGDNNYVDIRVDYTRGNVTVRVFLGSLLGDLYYIRNQGSGRFLNVTKDDTVFIYLSDHGSSGIFAFPNHEYLTSSLLTKALKKLKRKCKYVMVFVEACESGSLFYRYLSETDKGIFVLTAANSKEPSYAIYYDSELKIYLGDEFSVNFLEYLDATNQNASTVGDLYKYVKAKTVNSHVSAFGDKSMLNLKLSTFFKEKHYGPTKIFSRETLPKEATEAVASPDVDVAIALKILKNNPNDEKAKEIIKQSRMIEAIFHGLQSMIYSLYKIDVTQTVSITSENIQVCYKKTLDHYYSRMQKYMGLAKSFQYFGHLRSACAQGLKASHIIDALNKAIRETQMQH